MRQLSSMKSRIQVVFCDQIQTWERERGDENPARMFIPWQAEVVNIDVSEEPDTNRPHVVVTINYIASNIMQSHWELMKEVENELVNILLKHPKNSIEKLLKDSPFRITVQFCINMRPLSVDIDSDC